MACQTDCTRVLALCLRATGLNTCADGGVQGRILVCGGPGQDHYYMPLPTFKCYNSHALKYGSSLVVEAAGQLPSLPPPLKSGPMYNKSATNGSGGVRALANGQRTCSKLCAQRGSGVAIQVASGKYVIFWYVISQCYRPTRKT